MLGPLGVLGGLLTASTGVACGRLDAQTSPWAVLWKSSPWRWRLVSFRKRHFGFPDAFSLNSRVPCARSVLIPLMR